ncbi:MAG: dTMP kinase [Burkholderiales bacterium]|nr:dTMP kinase [Burkholderiales bacterium]MDP2398757.1 dTMP kinase [Burkholderiales bacterium]
MSRGRFITLEGMDGAGKTTHLEWLRQRLSVRALPLIVTREPGGTALGEALRKLLLDSHEPRQPDTEALLMFAARREHIATVIAPALAAGKWVLCDRFTDATYAYQAGGSGMAWERVAALESWVQGELQPDLTLYFDLEPELGRARTRQARVPDRFEREQLEFYERVRAAYLRRAREHPERIRIIDAARTIAEIQLELEKTLLIY